MEVDVVKVTRTDADVLAELAWYELVDEIEKEVPVLLSLQETASSFLKTPAFWQGAEVLNTLKQLNSDEKGED